MSQYQEFLSTLNRAFTSPLGNERVQASELLLKHRTSEPDATVGLTTGIMEAKEFPVASRMLASTYLAGCFLPPPEEHNAVSLWVNISPQSKEHIKGVCLRLLVDPEPMIMRSAGVLISTVFAIDCLTENTWDSLLPALTENVENKNMAIKKAAVTTLGFICDVLRKQKISTLSDERIDFLLTGICKGLQELDDLTETAIQAFADSIQFLQKKLENEKISDFIMELLIKLLRKVHETAKGTILERKLIVCLAKVSKHQSKKLGKYYEILYPEVLKSYESGPIVLVACNHFFMSMAKIDETMKTEYLANFWKGIMEVSLKGLLALQADEDDEETTGGSVVISILDIMTHINRLYSEFTFPVLKDFIAKYIELSNDNSKLAALIAFESLVEVKETPELLNFVYAGFFGILNFLQNGTPMIRKNASRFLLKIVKFLPDVFFQDVNFLRASKILIQIMEIPSDPDTISIIQGNAAMIFSELTKSMKKNPSYQILMKSITHSLFSSICKTSLHATNIYTVDNYFSIIFDFVQRVIEPRLLGNYLLDFFNYLKQVQASNSPNKIQLYEFLFINMTVMITYITRNEVKFFSNSNNDPQKFLKELYNFIIEIFQQNGGIISEGLLLMASILTASSNDNFADVEGYLKNFLLPSLKDYQKSDILKSAIDSLTQCIKRFETQIEGFIFEIYTYFISLLQNDLIEKDLKVSIFFALSDFVLHLPNIAKQNFSETIKLSEMALQAVIHLQSSDQEGLVEHAEVLKETLIDFYLCLIHGIYLKTSECDIQIEGSMLRVCEFISLTTKPELNPSINYMSNCLGLLIDFYAKKKSINLIKYDVIVSLYQSMEKVRNFGDITNILDYTKKYFGAIESA